MSRSVIGTPSKQAVKKAQSSLKGSVSSFGSFLISWLEDAEQVKLLLEHTCTLLAKQQAVNSCSSSLSAFSTIVPDSTFISERLIASILLEVESSLLQIRTFEKRMGDTLCAMTVCYENALKVVQNESIDVFDDTSIFTADHVLEMQQLQRAYMLEYRRKGALLRQLYGHSGAAAAVVGEADSWAGLPKLPELRTLDCALLQTITSDYPDVSSASLIPIDKVEAFVQRNSIRQT